jgi:predicted phage terminase large subunit-like protein
MNDPVSGEHRKFKLEKFRYITADMEKQLSFMQVINFVTIDRAYSTERTADATGIVVVSVDKENNWYVRMAERFKGTESELINKIFDLHSYFHPQKIGIEQKAFNYTLKPTLEDEMRKRNQFFLVTELKDLGRKKTIRIEGLIPRFETGSIFLRQDQTELIDELIKFPASKHDDLADALAYQLEMVGPAAQGGKARVFYPKQKPIIDNKVKSQQRANIYYGNGKFVV